MYTHKKYYTRSVQLNEHCKLFLFKLEPHIALKHFQIFMQIQMASSRLAEAPVGSTVHSLRFSKHTSSLGLLQSCRSTQTLHLKHGHSDSCLLQWCLGKLFFRCSCCAWRHLYKGSDLRQTSPRLRN